MEIPGKSFVEGGRLLPVCSRPRVFRHSPQRAVPPVTPFLKAGVRSARRIPGRSGGHVSLRIRSRVADAEGDAVTTTV